MKNSNNISAFFALLRAGLWEQDARLLDYESIDYDDIYRIATEQSVIGLLTAGFEHVVDEKIPKDVLLTFIGETMQIEQRNLSMNHFVCSILKKLCQSDVFPILVKGQGIAQCYERPNWRASGDIDLFFDSENYFKAYATLSPLAHAVENEDVYAVHIALVFDSWEVELHGSLRSGLGKRIDKMIDDIQNETFRNRHVRVWRNQDIDVYLPSSDNDVFFVFSHILQHFFKGGVGLRQICDWCRLLWTYKDTIDKDLLESRLRKAGIMSEWRAFSAFAVEWLGMPLKTMPLYSDDIQWRNKADKIMRAIIKSGNFGHNRDGSYLYKRSVVVRKAITFWRATCDGIYNFSIFPKDSIRVWCRMMEIGVKRLLG